MYSLYPHNSFTQALHLLYIIHTCLSCHLPVRQPSMPINGHTASSHTLFAPRQNGQLTLNRTPVTASPEPSAVRPGGLRVSDSIPNSHHSLPDETSVDGERPRDGGWQDKVALSRDREASGQPASRQHPSRSAQGNGISPRGHSRRSRARRTEPFTLHVSSLLKAEVKRQAEMDGLSASATGAALLEWAIRQKLHLQQAATLETALETILNRIIGRRDARLAHLLVRIAFSSEQGRSLDSTILSRLPGMTPDMLEDILDRSAQAAKAKITQTSPQLEDILQELGEMLTDKEKQDAK